MPTTLYTQNDLINIIRSGTLTNAVDSGSNFQLSISGSDSDSLTLAASAVSHSIPSFVRGVDVAGYVISGTIDHDSPIVQIPSDAQITEVRISVNVAVSAAASGHVQRSSGAGTAECNAVITFGIRIEPTGGVGTTSLIDNQSDAVGSVSSAVNETRSVSLSEPGTILEGVWDFSGAPITKSAFEAMFVTARIRMQNSTFTNLASISAGSILTSNGITNNNNIDMDTSASLVVNTTLWSMEVDWLNVDYDIIANEPADRNEEVTVERNPTGEDLTKVTQVIIIAGEEEYPAHIILQTEDELIFLLPPLPTTTTDVSIQLIFPTEFGGSVVAGSLEVLFANASGIYTIVPNKRNDTLYDRDTGETIDYPIPTPFARTGFVGG
jgi:hypothetical protein